MGNELTNAETGGQIVSVLEEIRVDDWLGLMREENKFDDNAIVLAAESGQKAGYVPEKDNVIFARLMEAGGFLRSFGVGAGRELWPGRRRGLGLELRFRACRAGQGARWNW